MAVADVQTRFNNTLRELGWPEHAIQGVGMNANDESSWNPTIGGDNGQAYGLLQWNGPRKRALFAFAAANGMDPGDPVLQARFLHHEGQTNEKASVAETWAARSPGEAGAVFVEKFERPAQEHLIRRKSSYLGGGGISGGEGSDTATGGTEGDTLGWAMGEQDRDLPPFEDAPRTWRDRLRTGLVGGGEMLTALGAGHGSNFRATDAFLAGEEERRRLKGGQARADASVNQTVAWLDRLGPEFADLADLARSGDAKSATDAALKRKAEMDKAALEGGGSQLPEGMDKELYQSGQHLGQINRNLQSLEGLLIEMDKAIAAGDTEKFRALKEAAQTVEIDFKAGMGNYQSFGNEPNQAALDQGGLGIPQDLVSEKELVEILNQNKGDFVGMASDLVQKYPDLAPYLGGAIGAGAVGTGGGAGVAGAVGGALGELAGAGAGAVAGDWLRDFLKDKGSAEGAKAFNKLRIEQAKLRLAHTGKRIQDEMRVVGGQYATAMPGQDFSTVVGQQGWDKYVYGANDPSDPDGWG